MVGIYFKDIFLSLIFNIIVMNTKFRKDDNKLDRLKFNLLCLNKFDNFLTEDFLKAHN